jgi:uncharacterized repeat protein (TIGR01451 family)
MIQSALNKYRVSCSRWLKGYVLFLSLFLLSAGLSRHFPVLAQSSPPDVIIPSGQVRGCEGTPLEDYTNFTIGLYRPDPTTPGAVRGLVPLASTPPASSVPPNTENNNPFFLNNAAAGGFNFVLNPQQVTPETTYVLIVNPPEESRFDEREIKLQLRLENNQLQFTATAFDGLPVNFDSQSRQVSGKQSASAGEIGFSLNIGICDERSIRITKSSDRASASPGEVAVYRLQVENLATGELENIEISDTLPRGFQLLEDSIQAELAGEEISLSSDRLLLQTQERTFILELEQPLPEDAVLNIAYAAELTPDALRGDGNNAATVEGTDSRNGIPVQDGPAIHEMRVTGDLLSDAGTIIGRVFVDRNLDGEKQPNEPGVPNAVIILDNGVQVTTDAEGLFSITNVLPGPRTGILDLSRLEGYTLAPNPHLTERNSPSRLVQLSPGGTVRMNFAVIPISEEEEEEEK